MPTRVWTPGDAITAARLNALESSVDAVGISRPMFAVNINAAVSLTTATATALTWDTTGLDTDGGHSTSVQPDRYTFATTGYWLCQYRASFGAVSSTGVRQLWLNYNGSTLRATELTLNSLGTTYATSVAGTKIVHATNVGDYLQVMAYQNSGSTLTVLGTGSPAGAEWSLTWLHS